MSIYEQPSPRRQPAGSGWSAPLLLLLIAVSAFLTWWFWPWKGSGLNPQEQLRPVEARGELSDLEKTSIDIYEKASPSLVQVTTSTETSGGFFGLDVQQVPRGVGSGFVWDEDGHIVTNNHVVQTGDTAKITLADHSTYEAQQAWSYPDLDVAVLWIKAPKNKLHPIMLGSSNDLRVGQMAFALGDPFGLDLTMTMGIISALGRKIEAANGHEISGVIQTSAPINPGNSGGPLLDSAGRLIGMNTAILSPSGAFAGIGFAIPVDEINPIVTELIRHGKIVRPRLGVQVAEKQLARQLGVDKGAVILKVIPNTPAAQAGLRGPRRDTAGNIYLGDIIVAVDGKPIDNPKELTASLEKKRIGDTVTLTVVRDGQRIDINVTLGEVDEK
jgi:S1-C subfamily serine protease